jgi:hypothetical protein
MAEKIPRQIVPSVEPAPASAAQVAREFHALLDSGAKLHVAGRARRDPRSLLERGYTPKHRIDLFDTRIYLSNVRQNPELRFYVAWVVPPVAPGRRPDVHARIFYKDLSLVWRSASHMTYDHDGSVWIGKGAVREHIIDAHTFSVESVESTTDLPLEIQNALEQCMHALKRVPGDRAVLELVLRRGATDRVEPYDDFVRPRERAAADPRNRINGGRSIARFRRNGDPRSLEFVPGYEPDFARGILERTTTRSTLYGGRLRRFRILSRNREIQYLFFAGRWQVWIVPPQATTTELSSYGVRTIDVVADDDAFLAGWEYHYFDPDLDPPGWFSQIPEGYVGRPCPLDPNKADASPWLDDLPVVREFRQKVLRRRPTRSRDTFGDPRGPKPRDRRR